MSRMTAYRPRTPLPRGLSDGAMPADFGDAAAEVAACQKEAALFDYSFLLRVGVYGPDAVSAVSAFCGRDFTDLDVGGIRYALRADDAGHLRSDLTVWRTGPRSVEVMSGRAEDARDLRLLVGPLDAHMTDDSASTACLAVQGPASDDLLAEFSTDNRRIENIEWFGFRDMSFAGVSCRIGRLGFTGLPGVEILCGVPAAIRLWRRLETRIRPAGFCAADIVRLKAGLALFSNEFLPPVTAADAGFPHLQPMAAARDRRAVRVCFSVSEQGLATVPGDLDQVLWSEEQIFPPPPGRIAVTSMARDPEGRGALGMGYINASGPDGPVSDPSGRLRGIAVNRRF